MKMKYNYYKEVMTMNETTFNRRVEELIKDVDQHPHKAEILQLAEAQLMCDRNKLLVPNGYTQTD